MAFNESSGETEGAVIVGLKSGGLCRSWIENALGVNARVNNVHPDSYRRIYKADREQSFVFYKFPVADLAALYWGYIFGGIRTNYALVVDNYLILASSEKVIADFVKPMYTGTTSKMPIGSNRLKQKCRRNITWHILQNCPVHCLITNLWLPAI